MPKFDPAVIKAIDAARSLGVRSGDDHPHTHVWVVVIQGRVLVRSWNDKPSGWFRAFLKEPIGGIRVGKKEFPVRGVRVRNAKLLNAMNAALDVTIASPGTQ